MQSVSFRRNWCSAILGVATCASMFLGSALANDTAEYVVHTFAASNTAASPHDGVVLGPDGALYGTSYWGGTGDVGTVFRIAQDGTETVLHNFSAPDPSTGINADGMEPNARLVLGNDGNFYGVTSSAGPGACGTLFRISPSGTFTVVHAFSGSSFGGPDSALVADSAGNLYGISFGCGVEAPNLFRYSPDGSYTTVHSFASNETPPDLGIAFGGDGNLSMAPATATMPVVTVTSFG
jgi:uncharacterized repeat protein (TIGR03803 family)